MLCSNSGQRESPKKPARSNANSEPGIGLIAPNTTGPRIIPIATDQRRDQNDHSKGSMRAKCLASRIGRIFGRMRPIRQRDIMAGNRFIAISTILKHPAAAISSNGIATAHRGMHRNARQQDDPTIAVPSADSTRPGGRYDRSYPAWRMQATDRHRHRLCHPIDEAQHQDRHPGWYRPGRYGGSGLKVNPPRVPGGSDRRAGSATQPSRGLLHRDGEYQRQCPDGDALLARFGAACARLSRRARCARQRGRPLGTVTIRRTRLPTVLAEVNANHVRNLYTAPLIWEGASLR